MTRDNCARSASGNAKDSVWRAAEAAAPHALMARAHAVRYAHEAGAYLAPRARRAAGQALIQYDTQLVPRLERARKSLPPGIDDTAARAAVRTRNAAQRAREVAGPRIEEAILNARAAAGPAREQAVAGSAAALATLRGGLTAKEIHRMVRRKQRRAATGRALRRIGVVGLVAGGAFAVWKWWDQQTNPDWLMEPPPATEVPGGALPSEHPDAALDPDVEAKQAEVEEENEESGEATDPGRPA